MNRFFGVHEVRVLMPDKRIFSGCFDSAESALHAIETAPIYKAAWLSLNPFRPEIVTVDAHLTPAKETMKDELVLSRKQLLIDIDSPRPPETNATDAEKQLAREQAQQVREYLTGRGWPAPMFADSGNGWHLVFLIDLPNDDDATALVRSVLERLKKLFPRWTP